MVIVLAWTAEEPASVYSKCVIGLIFWADMALLTNQPIYLPNTCHILYIEYFKTVNTRY